MADGRVCDCDGMLNWRLVLRLRPFSPAFALTEMGAIDQAILIMQHLQAFVKRITLFFAENPPHKGIENGIRR